MVNLSIRYCQQDFYHNTFEDFVSLNITCQQSLQSSDHVSYHYIINIFQQIYFMHPKVWKRLSVQGINKILYVFKKSFS